MANAARALADQAHAEGTLDEAGANLPVSATRLEFARRSRFKTHAEVVQAARAGESRRQRDIQHVFSLGQQRLGVRQRQALEKGLRRNPRPAGKEPMKMEGA